jgi:hypothetical protein
LTPRGICCAIAARHDRSRTIEFSSGYSWDCSFSSAWTLYGRSYRSTSPEGAVEDPGSIASPESSSSTMPPFYRIGTEGYVPDDQGEGPLSEPTTVAQARRRELVFMPLSRH